MLDVATLRVAFGVVAVAVLVLFYVATYRTSHSAYSGWWCVSLALFIAGASLYLADGTRLQVVANPAGNALTTAGAGAVWAGTRSLRGQRVRWRWLVGVPLLVLAVALLDDPVDDVWTGGPFFLLSMSLALAAASWELRTMAAEPAGRRAEDRSVRTAVVAMSVMAGILAAFYLLRAAALAFLGAEDPVFDVVLGSQSTTLLTMVMLVVVTYTMSILGHEQQRVVLRSRAERDELTGLLNRGAFFRLLTAVLDDPASARRCAVLVADLDGFKALNDSEGHAAGDRALSSFATTVAAALDGGDAAARLGGDEFAVLLTEEERAEAFVARVADGLRSELGLDGPTVSFGVAVGWTGADPDELVHRADVALYRAKTEGRDRAVRWDDGEPGTGSGRTRATRRTRQRSDSPGH
ncbi:GGDEF domain-containing protein [Nocardioides litoris]|uniref:GGDEF domain-containing protein n=1 Tax=Nocardioides litoris TaxID=1926648 RepID=UPI00112080E2|nr:GGDEF domain-containing protein [Nocardioides litoris]